MKRFMLAGGGTGGHVNPLLALAQMLKKDGHEVFVLGTREGLEAKLVPERGFRLLLVPRVPFPRKLSLKALGFPRRFASAVKISRRYMREHSIDCLVGFGGYVSAPAYIAAKMEGLPIIVHEANSLTGLANRIGAKLTRHLAVAFPNTNLKGARLTGMPLRPEIVESLGSYDQQQARVELGLDPVMPTLLVTGGSLGAESINEAVLSAKDAVLAAGIQIYHVVGEKSGLEAVREHGYSRVKYCSRMDVAIAAASFAISRSGASTVAEFSAAGLPALYVPYPVGNGEQRLNALTVVDAGGAIMLEDRLLNADQICSKVIPLISNARARADLQTAARAQGIPDATERLRDLVMEALDTTPRD